MKLPNILLSALSAGMLLSACDKQASTPASPTPEPKPEPKPAATAPAAPAEAEVPVKVDADKLVQSLGSAGTEEQSRAGKAAQAIRAENYGAALGILGKLVAEGHLTPEQKEVLNGIVSQLQKLTQQKR